MQTKSYIAQRWIQSDHAQWLYTAQKPEMTSEAQWRKALAHTAFLTALMNWRLPDMAVSNSQMADMWIVTDYMPTDSTYKDLMYDAYLQALNRCLI